MFANSAQASLIFSISSPDEPVVVQVGETVDFDVHVSGIELDQTLDFLSASLTYDSTLIEPAVLVLGEILPSSFDVETDFNAAVFTGLVDVFYETESPTLGQLITDNGVFFTLRMQALSPGAGSISFDFIAAKELTDNDSFVPVPTSGTGTTYVVVPEPSTMTSTLILLLLGMFVLVRRNLI